MTRICFAAIMPTSLDKERTLKPRVFVSHSHKDEVYARKVVSWLSKVGFEPWASFEECSDKYRVEIDSALLACDIFLLVASKDSFAGPEVAAQVRETMRDKKAAVWEYKDAGHAFARPGGAHYDHPSADLADMRTLSFLEEHLIGKGKVGSF